MNKMKLLLVAVLFFGSATAQDMWKYFKPADFAARRAKVMEQIGDGVAHEVLFAYNGAWLTIRVPFFVTIF